MLPFLKPKRNAGMLIAKRKADPSEPMPEMDPMQACAEELLSAIDSRDSAAIASALKSAFLICDSMPHEEYESTGE